MVRILVASLLIVFAAVSAGCFPLPGPALDEWNTTSGQSESQEIGIPESQPLAPISGRYGIFTMLPDGSDIRLLSSSDHMRNHAHVNSGRILVSEYRQDLNGDGRRDEADLASSDVSIISMDGSQWFPVAHRPGYDITPVWSPDGYQVLYSSDRDNRTGFLDLYVYDLRDDSLRNLTRTVDAIEGDPHWVGDQIVFNRIRSDGTARLWIMQADGSEQRQLTNPSYSGRSVGMYPFGDFDPKLSPDGGTVVFERHLDDDLMIYGNNVGNWDIFTVDVVTGVERVLVGGAGVDVVPTWSPDGGSLAYWQVTPDHFTIFTVPATGGAPRRLFAPRADLQAEMPDWYLDDGVVRLIFSAYRD